jgi:hypothetical protein
MPRPSSGTKQLSSASSTGDDDQCCIVFESGSRDSSAVHPDSDSEVRDSERNESVETLIACLKSILNKLARVLI